MPWRPPNLSRSDPTAKAGETARRSILASGPKPSSHISAEDEGGPEGGVAPRGLGIWWRTHPPSGSFSGSSSMPRCLASSARSARTSPGSLRTVNWACRSAPAWGASWPEVGVELLHEHGRGGVVDLPQAGDDGAGARGLEGAGGPARPGQPQPRPARSRRRRGRPGRCRAGPASAPPRLSGCRRRGRANCQLTGLRVLDLAGGFSQGHARV